VAYPEADQEPAALAAALEGAGGIFYWMGRWDEAERHYSRCLELRRRLGDRAALAEALYNLSFVYAVPPPPQQDLERARSITDEALRIYEELDDTRGRAKVLWNIAAMEERGQRPTEARDVARRAVELFRGTDDRFGLGWALHSVGLAAAQLRDFDEASSTLTEALEIFSAARDITGIALLLGDFGLLAGFRGDTPRASRLWGAALAAEERSGQALVTNFEQTVAGWSKAIRGSLSDEEFERLVAAGREMTVEAAIDLALGRGDEPTGAEPAP
jgi:tetratricopeptide (TPR) repeat protein